MKPLVVFFFETFLIEKHSPFLKRQNKIISSVWCIFFFLLWWLFKFIFCLVAWFFARLFILFDLYSGGVSGRVQQSPKIMKQSHKLCLNNLSPFKRISRLLICTFKFELHYLKYFQDSPSNV